MSAKPVLVAGAGIAGLTVAIALARAGASVILAERRAGFSEVGAGIQLSPNATSVLKRLGLSGEVARMAVMPKRLDIRRWHEAAPFAGMPMNEAPEADGAPFLTIRRADLQTALLDALRMTPGVRLLVGRSLTALSQHSDGVSATLTTERGQAETIEAAVAIGADGLWSAARGLTGDAAEPRFLGYEAWRALVPAAAAPEAARRAAVNLWLGRQGHAVHYPVACGREINLVVIRAGQEKAAEWSRPGDAASILGFARSAAAPLKALVEAAPSWQVWSLADRAPSRMAIGRIALIGDAAHPVLPFLAQGAALAIEDSGVLAQLLAPALASPEAGAVEAALARFAALRGPRAARVQDVARGNGRMYHAGFPLAFARDIALRRLGDDGMRRRYGWIYGWRAAPG